MFVRAGTLAALTLCASPAWAGALTIASTSASSYYTESGNYAPERSVDGKQSTAWTKTDANTGTATLASGHGILQDDKVDVFWDGGVRYNMDAITVAGNDVTVDGGAGDDLPASDTTMVLCKITELDTDFDGDLASLIVAHSLRHDPVGSRVTLVCSPSALLGQIAPRG